MAMSTLASEKNRALLQRIVVHRQRVLQTVTSLVFRGHDLRCSPENRKFLSPARSQIFAMEKIDSPREWRKWSLSLGHN